MTKKKVVVVIGAGFGGLVCTRALKKANVEILMVDRTNHHLFQPLLYQVATAALPPSQIASSVREILSKQKNARVIMAEVASIDKAAKTITLTDYEKPIAFDYLVVATGARHSYFGNDKWEPFAPGLKSIEDALLIRDKILSSFERAEFMVFKGGMTREQAVEKYLNFVVIGGGPTGVELAGAIAEIAKYTLFSNFRLIKPEMAKIHLVEMMPTLLTMLPKELSERARTDLEALGVNVLTETKVTEITADTISMEKAGVTTSIVSQNIIWAAGNEASPLLQKLDIPLDRPGRAIVGPDLSIPGHPDIFVIGDAAHVKSDFSDPESKPLPAVAPLAIQNGKWVAHTIRYQIEPDKRLPFKYFDKGTLATIGRGKAVGMFRDIKFTGYIAWLGWCFVHIVYLIGFRNRIAVMLEWLFLFFTGKHGVRLIYGKKKN